MNVRARLLNQALKINKDFWLDKKTVSAQQVAQREESLSRWLPNIPGDIDVQPLSIGGVAVDQLTPPERSGQRTLIYLHGGGFIAGSPATTHRDYIWRVAKAAKACVWAVNYRKLPEYPFPAALDDAYSVYRQLLGDCEPSAVALTGDSAGGGLALALVLRLKDEKEVLPAAVSVASPWTDLSCSGASVAENSATEVMVPEHLLAYMADLYRDGQDAEHPYISPLFGDFSGFPPTQLLVSDAEILRDDSIRVAERMQEAGVPVELIVEQGMPHVWPVFARFLPEGRSALERMGRFLNIHMLSDAEC